MITGVCRARPRSDGNRLTFAAKRDTVGSTPDHPTPGHVDRRRRNDAKYWRAGADQRNVDSEFVATCDEFSCAVEGIDKKIGLVFKRRGVCSAPLRLFRDDRNTGRKIFETLPNHRFGGFIRCRYWGPVGLAAQRRDAQLPNGCRRARGNCRHVIDKRGACGNVEDGHGGP